MMRSKLVSVGRVAGRRLSTAVAESGKEEMYPYSMKIMHWTMAALVIGGVGTVLAAQDQPKTPEGNKRRAELMFWHKSAGLTVSLLLPVRVWMRFTSRLPASLPVAAPMHFASQATHFGLYGGLFFMATTGVAMGWYSNRGALFAGRGASSVLTRRACLLQGYPFWVTTFPTWGTDPELTKTTYKWHKECVHRVTDD